MSDIPRDPIEIYRAGGLSEAYAIRNLLEANTIPVVIENELLQGALGELPLGWNTAPRIIVDRAHETGARTILEEFLRKPEPIGSKKDIELRCLTCGSPMGNRNSCPACGWSYEVNENEPDAATSNNEIAPQIIADAIIPSASPSSNAPAEYLKELRDWGKILLGCAIIGWIVLYAQATMKCYFIKSWPVTRAAVIDRDGVIQYRYSVNGKEYSICEFSPDGGELSPELRVMYVLAGDRDIYYNSENPSERYFVSGCRLPGIGTYIFVSLAFILDVQFIRLGVRGLRPSLPIAN